MTAGIMGMPIARVGDTIDHGGHITEGSPNWHCNDQKIARVGDKVMCDQHGEQRITTGSPNWNVNGIPMARVGSLCSCGAKVNSGSHNWSVP